MTVKPLKVKVSHVQHSILEFVVNLSVLLYVFPTRAEGNFLKVSGVAYLGGFGGVGKFLAQARHVPILMMCAGPCQGD